MTLAQKLGRIKKAVDEPGEDSTVFSILEQLSGPENGAQSFSCSLADLPTPKKAIFSRP